MKELNREKMAKKFDANQQLYSSVCNSCACAGGACQTCKGCKDKGENIKEVKKDYKKA